MSYKVMGGTQSNWMISLVDGQYRITETINRLLGEEYKGRFIILWAWQTESGLRKIRDALEQSDVFFMTDKSKAELIGCGRWLKELAREDLSHYWKDQPQWEKKWEYPYLLEVKQLDRRLLRKILDLSESERRSIVGDKVINKRKFFSNPELNKVSNPDGGSIWEASAAQDNEILKAQEYFASTNDGEDPPIERTGRMFWWVCQGESYTEDRGHRFLWAPFRTRDGRTQFHWDNVRKVRKDDIIFNYANGALRGISVANSNGYDFENNEAMWEKNGTRVDINHYEIEQVSLMKLKARMVELKASLNGINGPFDANGDIKQGYLFDFSIKAAGIIKDIYGKLLPEPLESIIPTIEGPPMVIPEKITHIYQYIASKGFTYSLQDIANLYLSLRAKPFVILAGISGTGKTQLVRLFAEAIQAKFKQIPVKPDWTDNSDLIGYKNLAEEFQEKELVKVLNDACKKENSNKIYMVLLDEMNLARVEHYFSDFLSVIETRRHENGEIITDCIIQSSEIGNKFYLANLYFPENFYLVGTVNMDETTHPFSRKVLDRANSIELNEIDLHWNTFNHKVDKLEDIGNNFLMARYTTSKDLDELQKNSLSDLLQRLIAMNDILKMADLQFAYRVRDEVCFYMTYQKEIDSILPYDEAFDYQVMQKILPRIYGSSQRIKHVLVELIKHLSGKQNISDSYNYDEIETSVGELSTHKYRRSLSKLFFMLRKFEDDGFTSFWL